MGNPAHTLSELRDDLTRLFAQASRFAKIQLRIWRTRATITLLRLAVVTAFFSLAFVLILLASLLLIFAFYFVLTDVLHFAPAWALLILSGIAFALAAILLTVSARIIIRIHHGIYPV